MLTLAEAFRAALFDAAVWTPGKIVLYSAVIAIDFAVFVLAYAPQYTPHFASRRNVENGKTYIEGLWRRQPFF